MSNRSSKFRKVVYPQISFHEDNQLQNNFENEFEYQLWYLVAYGLLTGSIQSEYYITRFGRGFIEKARKTVEFEPLIHRASLEYPISIWATAMSKNHLSRQSSLPDSKTWMWLTNACTGEEYLKMILLTLQIVTFSNL
jgi:hypothetical protein